MAKSKQFWKSYHKWAGLILSLFLLFFSISGILLNHRNFIGAVDIQRSWLPSSYQYKNWNLGAIRGTVVLDDSCTLVYGNIGCFKLDDSEHFSDFNQGFPDGIDHRKISKLLYTSNKRLFAGTLNGLYERVDQQWVAIALQNDHPRITDLIEVDDTLHILTRSELGLASIHQKEIHVQWNILPTPSDYRAESTLFRTLWVMHSGEILGFAGQLLVDGLGLLFIFFSLTGVLWFVLPKWIKRAKKSGLTSKNKVKWFTFSVKYHVKIGIYAFAFLAFTAITGIFLRPPFLIAIASSSVPNIPYTLLDTPNAWHDQLRAIRYHEAGSHYLVSTSKGMYLLNRERNVMQIAGSQPPVSVMGINAFEQLTANDYLIGSFSGLYVWNPMSNQIFNPFSGEYHRPKPGMTKPISENMVAGFYQMPNAQGYFDYDKGAVSLVGEEFPKMPESILTNAPMSLWNLSLEVHTGRIFQDAIGPWYILIVPLVGLSTFLLVLSGAWRWYKRKISSC